MRWDRLTLGKPAALESPPGARGVEEELAALTGCERAVLAPSTLHVFWDLFGILAKQDVAIFLDGGSYPIAQWGVERAAGLGVPVRRFRQHDTKALRSLLKGAGRKRPIVVADGYCISCGATAPIEEYLECVKPRSGLVVLDDTQALGIFGHSQGRWAPYGKEGGGSLRRVGVRDQAVVLVSSLAKAFGTPVAVLAASGAIVEGFELFSETRNHCSPPSAAVIAAASRALAINSRRGDAVRRRLAQRVEQFWLRLEGLNLVAPGGLFPVQALRLREGIDAGTLHETLSDRGVQTVLHRGRNGTGARISFIITARHTAGEIDRAAACLVDAVVRRPRRVSKGARRDDDAIASAGGAVRGVF